MRFDSLGLVDFAIGLVNLVLNFPSGQVIFFGGGRGGGRTREGRMEERMEKGPTFHFVIRAMRKSSRLYGKVSIPFVSDMKILTVGRPQSRAHELLLSSPALFQLTLSFDRWMAGLTYHVTRNLRM